MTTPLYQPDTAIDELLATRKPTNATDDEFIPFAEECIKQLENSEMVEQFMKNVEEVGTKANEIDASFDRVTRSFQEMVKKYGSDFPEISNFLDQWMEYNNRWIQNLSKSRDVASENVAMLRRFNEVFLEMVSQVKTEDDIKEVIEELQQFVDEDHTSSQTMYLAFQALSRDVGGFIERFDEYLKDRGVELENEAKRLKLEIDQLEEAIKGLDKNIEDSTIALAVCGAMLNLIGVIAATSALAAYVSERNQKAKELLKAQNDLAEVNRKQVALANLQTQFDGVKPDIQLICTNLMLFADVWTAARSQAVQFQDTLRKGMEATKPLRFRLELELVRRVCGPLQGGLELYATKIGTRKRGLAAQEENPA